MPEPTCEDAEDVEGMEVVEVAEFPPTTTSISPTLLTIPQELRYEIFRYLLPTDYLVSSYYYDQPLCTLASRIVPAIDVHPSLWYQVWPEILKKVVFRFHTHRQQASVLEVEPFRTIKHGNPWLLSLTIDLPKLMSVWLQDGQVEQSNQAAWQIRMYNWSMHRPEHFGLVNLPGCNDVPVVVQRFFRQFITATRGAKQVMIDLHVGSMVKIAMARAFWIDIGALRKMFLREMQLIAGERLTHVGWVTWGHWPWTKAEKREIGFNRMTSLVRERGVWHGRKGPEAVFEACTDVTSGDAESAES